MLMLTVVTLSLLVMAASSEDKVLSSHGATMADNSASLAFNLYHTMAKEKDLENILISPVVVASALGLVALAGKESTPSQVKAVLGADKVLDEHLHAGLAELLTDVSNSTARNVTWKLGSRLYGPSSISFADGFVQSSKKFYNVEHSKINFRDKKTAMKSINAWTSKSTGGKLPEVIKDMERTDGAMIINAMFYKPHWHEQFHHKMVDDRAFLVHHSLTISLPMMHRTGLYPFYEDKDTKFYVLSMPLAHKMSTLIIIMPYHMEPLERLEKLLTRKQLDDWLSKQEEKAMAVSLPKVSLEVSHDLQKYLGELGLTEAVDKAKADLSNISGKKDLYLSNVLHVSALEWDTPGNPFDSSIYGSEKMKNPKLFYADHPFIFLVKDNRSKSILFIGRMVHPNGKKMKDEL